MKKLLLLLLTLVSLVAIAGCQDFRYSYYFASAETTPDSSWVYYVTITKKGKTIVDAEWNAFNIQGDTANTKGLSKYEASVEGMYNMATDPQKLKWHEQADLITEKFIKAQSVNERLPIPAGASIGTDDFYTLAEKALANGPVEKGIYENGYHFISNIETPKQETGKSFYNPQTDSVITVANYDTYTFGTFIVVNGSIVLAYYNTVFHGYRVKMDAANKIEKYAWDHDNDETTAPKSVSIIAPYTSASPKLYKTKNELGLSYGMKIPNGQSNNEYFEIAKKAGEYLVENQTFPSLVDGKLDGVAGVTITATEYVTLLDKLPRK